MLKRSVRILWEVLGAVLLLAGIAAGVLVWRVAQGPVSLDFVTPQLARELDALSPEIDVTLGSTVLTWKGWPETFALRVTDVRLTDRGGHTAEIPEVDLRLSVVALLHGTVAPTRITTRGADLTLVRGPASLRFAPPDSVGAAEAGPEADDAQQDLSRVLPTILDDLMAPPSPDAWLSYLSELRMRDMAVQVHDTRLGTTWRAPSGAVTLRRTTAGLAGRVNLDVALGDARVPTMVSLSYLRGSDSFVAAGAIKALEPAWLARALPVFAPLKGVTLPVTASGVGRFGLDGDVRNATTYLRAQSGRVALPEYFPEPLAVREAALRLEFDPSAHALEARGLRLALGTTARPGPTITGGARAVRDPDTGTIAVTADAGVANLEANTLPRYWPPGIQENGIARKWVTDNVRDGTLHRADLSAALTLPRGDPSKVTLDRLDGTMRYSGMRVTYLPGLRPVREVAGTATFDKSKLALDLAAGRLRGLRLREGTAVVSGLDTTDQFLSIDVETRGPLRDSLTPLAQPRVDLLSELGITPAQTSGTAEVSMAFDFPLLKDLPMEKVDLHTTAELREAGVANFFLGQNVSDGTLSLDITPARMTLRGSLRCAGLPTEVDWTERFDDTAQPRRALDATVKRLAAADLARLWRSPAPYLDGTASVNLHWRGDGEGNGELRAAANLKDAGLNLPLLSWRKPPGIPGHATVRVAVADETPRKVHHVDLIAGGNGTPRLEISGGATLGAAAGRLERARIDEIRLGKTRLREVALKPDGSGWRIDVGGGHLDAAPYLAGAAAPPDKAENGNGRGDADAGSAGMTGRAVTLTTRAPLTRVDFGEGRQLEQVRLTVKRDAQGHWRQIQFNANVPPRFERGADNGEAGARGTNVDVNYAPDSDGRQRLRARAENAGATLRALGILDSITGGQLRLDGTRRSTDPASPLDAELDLRNFKLRDAPILAKILSVAFLTGIGDVLSGEGLSFQRLEGDIVLDGPKVRTDLLHAYGPAIGVTAKGALDLDAETLDVRGVIVPAALVNRILGAIPLLGPIITGGEGEGLFAVMYRARGDLADPEISVNPLSALAPGFLRNLFGAIAEGEREPAQAIPETVRQPQGR